MIQNTNIGCLQCLNSTNSCPFYTGNGKCCLDAHEQIANHDGHHDELITSNHAHLCTTHSTDHIGNFIPESTVEHHAIQGDYLDEALKHPYECAWLLVFFTFIIVNFPHILDYWELKLSENQRTAIKQRLKRLPLTIGYGLIRLPVMFWMGTASGVVVYTIGDQISTTGIIINEGPLLGLSIVIGWYIGFRANNLPLYAGVYIGNFILKKAEIEHVITYTIRKRSEKFERIRAVSFLIAAALYGMWHFDK